MSSFEEQFEQAKSPRKKPALTPNGRAPAVTDIPAGELERLFALRHPDPHAILGAHPGDRGLVVRAYRPDATRILLLIDGEAPRPMARRREPGLFELLIEGRRDVPRYRFEVRYPRGKRFTMHDPYAFQPTLGDLDLYLWGEQKHERIYDRLGAHAREVDGIRGVSFAVWAPGAAGVSVVGDFNS